MPSEAEGLSRRSSTALSVIAAVAPLAADVAPGLNASLTAVAAFETFGSLSVSRCENLQKHIMAHVTTVLMCVT